MEVCLDLEVICHFGYVKNIDITEQGFYFIEVSLEYGNGADKTVVSPVGYFSAPSTLNSKVRKMTVNSLIISNRFLIVHCR